MVNHSNKKVTWSWKTPPNLHHPQPDSRPACFPVLAFVWIPPSLDSVASVKPDVHPYCFWNPGELMTGVSGAVSPGLAMDGVKVMLVLATVSHLFLVPVLFCIKHVSLTRRGFIPQKPGASLETPGKQGG